MNLLKIADYIPMGCELKIRRSRTGWLVAILNKGDALCSFFGPCLQDQIEAMVARMTIHETGRAPGAVPDTGPRRDGTGWDFDGE